MTTHTQAVTDVQQNINTRAWTATSKLNSFKITRNENRANLTCYSEHPTGNKADSTQLDVLYKPVVTVPQNSYSIMENANIRLECKVDANPKAKIIWRKVGSNVPMQVVTDSDINIYVLEQVSKNLNGNSFECFAENDRGRSQPAIVTLNVLCK